MRRLTIPVLILAFLVTFGSGLLLARATPVQAGLLAQQPAPTQTSPANRSIAIVNSDDQDEINVRSGPGTDYALVGKLLAGQQVPALGRSLGGDWVQIAFDGTPGGMGWVYAYLVTVNGSLPVVEPPPTPTPLVTPTVDPTLAAQFIIDIPATRLPTFTPPPPLVVPTYPAAKPVVVTGGGQIVYLIAGLAIAGLVGLALSFIKVRY